MGVSKILGKKKILLVMVSQHWFQAQLVQWQEDQDKILAEVEMKQMKFEVTKRCSIMTKIKVLILMMEEQKLTL